MIKGAQTRDMRAKRSQLLDWIRALAVIMVVLYHVAVELPHATLDGVARWFSFYGFLGVDIFFPLSGFLITAFLLKHHSPGGIRTFFLRRAFRILPLYYLALITFVIGSLITGIDRDLLDNIWKNALFLTGWSVFFEGRAAIPYTITWSLSVEEVAYILCGIFALIFRGRLALALLLLSLFSIALRYWLTASGYSDIYYFPPARFDSIAIGGLLAWAHHHKKPALVPLAGTLVAAWALTQAGHASQHTFIYLQITLITCIAIHLVQTYTAQTRNLVIDAVASIGFYSYFIYLFHYFVITGLGTVSGWLGILPDFWPFAAIVLIVTYGAAWLSYRIFEGPLMAFGRQLEAGRRSNTLRSPAE